MVKFYLKVIFKSPLIIISILFSTFIMLVQSSALKYSISTYTRITIYSYISFNLFFLLSSTYAMRKNYEISGFLEKDLFKKLISIIFTCIIISSVVFLIPLAIIMFNYFEGLNSNNIFLEILNYFLLWNLSNVLASIIGCCIGIVVDKWYAYMFSLIIYCGYISYIYGPINTIIKKLVCIFPDNIFIQQNDLAPILFNKPYLIDKSFSILSLLAIINMIYFIIRKKRIKLISIISFVIISAILICIVMLGGKFSKIGTESYEKFLTSDYIIEDYIMNLKTNSSLENSCEVTVKSVHNTDKLMFMLDNIFNLKTVLINNKECDFEHLNNKVIINYNLKSDEVIKIKFEYSAFIDISNYLGVNIYYVSGNYINLPDKEFYWYPLINDNKVHNFDVDLEAVSQVYTNLNIDNIIKENDKFQYKLSGTDVGCCLFAGEYKDINIDNVIYSVPRNYIIDLFRQDLDRMPARILDDNPSLEGKNKSEYLENKQYKKVIVGEWFADYKKEYLENEIHFYNDTIIINLGA